MIRLTHVEIRGFKSFREIDQDLGSLSVLIGANGSGKSNFVSFFNMVNHMMTRALGRFVGESGGANGLLFHGAPQTPTLDATLSFQSEEGACTYRFSLGHAAPDRFIFLREAFSSCGMDRDAATAPWRDLGSGHAESALGNAENPTASFISNALKRMRFFQFHDTSRLAPMKQYSNIQDNRFLKSNAGNLAAFLYMLRHQHRRSYDRIVRTIQRIMPDFEDFHLEPSALNHDSIMLEWRERQSTMTFGPHHLSDGTLRMMALTTLLLQPRELLPSLIIIDEPELGLHPAAIKLLAGMVHSASERTQIILSTQSSQLVDAFSLEHLIVTERLKQSLGASSMRSLNAAALSVWLEEHSVGEMWESNLMGGRPS